jgi:hypothetical protein
MSNEVERGECSHAWKGKDRTQQGQRRRAGQLIATLVPRVPLEHHDRLTAAIASAITTAPTPESEIKRARQAIRQYIGSRTASQVRVLVQQTLASGEVDRRLTPAERRRILAGWEARRRGCGT